QCDRADDSEHVEDVGADDIADGDVGLAAEGGKDGGRKLRQRGADGNQGEPDDGIGNPEPRCDLDCTVDKKRGTDNEGRETAGRHDNLDEETHGGTNLEELRLGGVKRAPSILALPVGAIGIDEVESENGK